MGFPPGACGVALASALLPDSFSAPSTAVTTYQYVVPFVAVESAKALEATSAAPRRV